MLSTSLDIAPDLQMCQGWEISYTVGMEVSQAIPHRAQLPRTEINSDNVLSTDFAISQDLEIWQVSKGVAVQYRDIILPKVAVTKSNIEMTGK